MWEKTHRYSGSLQKLTFYDLSPCGMNYQERFVTMDKEALNFEIFRYTKVDPECLRLVFKYCLIIRFLESFRLVRIYYVMINGHILLNVT